MAKNRSERKLFKGKIRGSYVTTTISMTLVLFLLGIVGYLILNAKMVSEHVKENICFSIKLRDDAREPDVKAFKKNLDRLSFIRYTEYSTKEQAAAKLEEDLGENFMDLLDENPLWGSIDLYLEAEYANPDSVPMIEKRIMAYDNLVDHVDYVENLLYAVNKGIRWISIVVVGFAFLLLVISFVLINNTIRLTVYSKRFLIRTMKLVGAARGFIRRPFIRSGVIQGVLSAVLASLMLSAFINFFKQQFDEVISLTNLEVILPLYIIVLGLGIIISYISTLFSVNKYLRIKSENLYY